MTTGYKIAAWIGSFLMLLFLAWLFWYFNYSETAKKKDAIEKIQAKENDFIIMPGLPKVVGK